MSKKNFTISTVATAPDPATTGTSLIVESGHGARFADDEPAIVFPAGEQPDSTNAEVVMITNIATDTLTITRQQESTTARTIVVGDVIIQGITAKGWNDLVSLSTHSNRADLDNVSGTNTGDDASIPIGYLDTDGTLAEDSDVKVPTQKAVRAYADTKIPNSIKSGNGDSVVTVDSADIAGEYLVKFDADGNITDSGIYNTDVLPFIDEDDMASDSDVHVPTQQSVKAYVGSGKFVWKGAWVTATSYSLRDTVENNGSGYVCILAHTSGDEDDEPNVGADWATYWDLFVEGFTSSRIQIDCSGGTSDTYGALTGLVNGSNTTYTVSNGSYVSGKLKVYLNGQLQTQGSSEDWTQTTPASGTFAFATAPATGDIITVEYLTT